MKIWRLSDPNNDIYARADRRGTWAKDKTGKDIRIRPLVIEWQPGSDTIGDFVWPGFDSDIIVREKIACSLLEKFTGFELASIEMVQDKKLYDLKKKPKSLRVLLPYQGPPIFDLWITKWVDINTDKSSIIDTEPGKSNIEGVEHYMLQWDASKVDLVKVHYPRVPGKGIFINAENLSEECLFKIHEFSGWIFCTDTVKTFIQSQKATNVSFLEMGETL